jgi:glucose-1-phosphate thymidylyltransferase
MLTSEVIGLIPCGGLGSRITPLPCSKEILPVGLRKTTDGLLRPKVVSHYLLEKMQQGGVRKAYFILRKGKWDIPDYYGDGSSIGMDLGYLIAALPYGPPYTLDQAYPFVRSTRVAFGFPDILFDPSDAFNQALHRQEATQADLVLGLYRINDARPSDMIATDRGGRVREIVLKPYRKKLKQVWMFAVWTPTFTEFLHNYLKAPRTSAQLPGATLPAELTVGHVIEAAIREGVATQSIFFRRQKYLDIGTPEGLHQVSTGQWHHLSEAVTTA